MRSKCAAFLIALFVSTITFAQVSRDTVNTAIMQVMAGKGKVTKAEYDKFWTSLPITKEQDKQDLINVMNRNFVDMITYQKQIWRCAEVAWNTQRTPICESALQIYAKVKENFRAAGADVSQMQNAEENSKRLLTAAASHTDLVSSDGRVLKLSPQLIQEAIASIDQKMARISQVLTIKYQQ